MSVIERDVRVGLGRRGMTDRADRIPCCVPFCRRTASRARYPDPNV
jgi:hypothetical protein